VVDGDSQRWQKSRIENLKLLVFNADCLENSVIVSSLTLPQAQLNILSSSTNKNKK